MPDPESILFVLVAAILAIGFYFLARRMSTARYKVGFIYDRCFVQKKLELPSGAVVLPLEQTGSSGRINDAVKQLRAVGFEFSDEDAARTLKNFTNTGHCVLFLFDSVRADDFIGAIEEKEPDAEIAAGAMSVVSANPALQLCAFAKSNSHPGAKFYIPFDRKIQHGTNIPGFLDALPDIETRARNNAKFALLLRLFRASLREKEVDNQLLFQLIIFEEVSDEEKGTFAERLRAYSEKIGFSGDLAVVAMQCGVELPEGKDVIDLIVKLRNAATHNGEITEAGLRQYNGEWATPVIKDKDRLHKLVCEALRYMFCCMVGHTRDAKAIKISGPIEIKFD